MKLWVHESHDEPGKSQHARATRVVGSTLARLTAGYDRAGRVRHEYPKWREGGAKGEGHAILRREQGRTCGAWLPPPQLRHFHALSRLILLRLCLPV